MSLESGIRFSLLTAHPTGNPPSGKIWMYVLASDGYVYTKNSAGVIEQLNASLSDEQIQDVIGGALADSTSIDFTYNDALNQIQASVIPGGVDHNSLLNYVANRHIDHSGVSINTTSPLTGGGDLTASRTLGLDVSAVNHNALLNYVASEHVDHSGVSINTAANSGLAGGGNITASRSLVLDVNNLVTQQFRPGDAGADDFVASYIAEFSQTRKLPRNLVGRPRPNRYTWVSSDFIDSLTASLTQYNSGTGASSQNSTYGIDLTENVLGAVQSDTGTTSTGRACLGSHSQNSMFLQAGTTLYFGLRAAVEALSNSSETFVFSCGFSSGLSASGLGVNFIGFRYSDTFSSGQIECGTIQGGTPQFVSSGVAQDTQYNVYELVATSSEVRFYINSTLVHATTTNIPSGPSQPFGFGWKIEKTIGTSQRNMSADWYYFGHNTASR